MNPKKIDDIVEIKIKLIINKELFEQKHISYEVYKMVETDLINKIEKNIITR